MTIQDWGSVGELVAAIATVATLAYLAIQIRANTRTTRAQSDYARQATNKQTLLALANDQQLAGVFRRGLASYESLEPDEQTQFTFLVSAFLSDAELAFADARSGINLSGFEAVWRGLRLILNTPGGREHWRRYAHSASSDFRDYVQSDLFADQGSDDLP